MGRRNISTERIVTGIQSASHCVAKTVKTLGISTRNARGRMKSAGYRLMWVHQDIAAQVERQNILAARFDDELNPVREAKSDDGLD
jgi:hypothetical protein